MKTISYIKKLQDKVNNVNKDLPNIESKVTENNTIINNVANKIGNINVPLSSLPNKTDAQAIQDKINKLIEIKVTDADPNEQITATCGDKSIQTQADSTGTGYLNPTKYGDWSVNGKLLSVTSAKQYELSLIPSLSEATWSNIAKVSESGKASEYWNVGDEKDVTLTTGETLTFQIYGFNHDDLQSGGKAGITFGMKNLMASNRQMNTSDTNSGGFTGSVMYKWLNGDCLNGFPTDLKNAIKTVNKKTSAGNQSSKINTNPMKVWLFSENEVGLNRYSVSGEGTKYPIFTTNNSRIKKLSNGSGSAVWWWLRSPYTGNSTDFCAVGDDGTEYTGYASYALGVCFGFSI